MSYGNAVQRAVYQQLSTALLVPVYDCPPQQVDASAAYPYITIGENVITEAGGDIENRAEVSITVHVWSSYAGYAECNELLGQIYNALHRVALPDQAGYYFINCDHDSDQTMLDADGVIRHGVGTYLINIQRG